MKIKNLNTYQILFVVEEIAQLSVNICYLDILTKAYIAKEFTDLDFSQYIKEDSVDLVEIYDQVEDIWEQVVATVGKEKVNRITEMAKMRYAEINSFDNKILETISSIGNILVGGVPKEEKNEGDTE